MPFILFAASDWNKLQIVLFYFTPMSGCIVRRFSYLNFVFFLSNSLLSLFQIETLNKRLPLHPIQLPRFMHTSSLHTEEELLSQYVNCSQNNV